jgi:hypothetical protein
MLMPILLRGGHDKDFEQGPGKHQSHIKFDTKSGTKRGSRSGELDGALRDF